MNIRFTKMEGLGNDYIFIDGVSRPLDIPESELSRLAQQMSDRHFGIGSDGLVLILPSQKADLRMRIFNADGSEAQMCGNAARCVGKYAYEHHLTPHKTILLETLAGVKELTLLTFRRQVQLVEVGMGYPKDIQVNVPLEIEGTTIKVTLVNMGNPHAVVFTHSVEDLDMEAWGTAIAQHPMFKEGVNVEVVDIVDANTLRMRVWERGSGETMACGTGACAARVAAVSRGFVSPSGPVVMDGGQLIVHWNRSTDAVVMIGPANEVFSGVYKDLPRMNFEAAEVLTFNNGKLENGD